ncbi:amidohydrolase family protein [Bradymonas sediminis]
MLRKRLLPILALLLFSAAACGEDSTDKDNPSENNDRADAGDTGGDSDAGDPDAGDGQSPDTGGPDDPKPSYENLVTCENPTTPPPQGRSCRTTDGTSNFVLMQGNILAGDTVYENGQILIDRSSAHATMTCVGCDCGDEADAAQATTIECAEAVISPGLINAHEHLGWAAKSPVPHGEERFDHRHDWRLGKRGHTNIKSGASNNSKSAVLYGELRHLLGGVTSMAGSGGAAGLVRNLDQSRYTEGLDVTVKYDTFPLGDSDGTYITEGCAYGGITAESVLANDIFLPHVSEGIGPEARNEFSCLSSSTNGGRDLVEANTSMIHGVGLNAADIAEVAAGDTKLVWSPRTNIDLYGHTADITTYDRLGVNIALGTDWVLSGSINMLRELQCVDYLNQNHYNHYFSDYQIWRMATANGAVALGVGDKVGTIAEGYIADLAVYNAADSDYYRAVINAGVEDVLLVMRGGKALIGEPNLIHALVPADEVDDCSGISICDASRLSCFKSDTLYNEETYNWTDIINSGTYGPFFCGEPENEPSCVPARPGEFSGMSTDLDSDGDGIPDAEDNCPHVFNPPRPLDGGVQADYDNDGIGDACDPCPLNEGDNCENFDADDRDGDGIPNDSDNCPSVANPDQADRDNDGIGDACDPCPDYANPGYSACLSSTYEIWDGTQIEGAKIRLENMIVTASDDAQAMMLQHTSGAAFDANGVAQSGVYVYMPNADVPIAARGDLIDIEATISSFGDSLQLTNPEVLTINSSDNPLPNPVRLNPADIATGGADADTYLGVLVRVDNVTVTSAMDTYGEFELTGGLRVDDVFYLADPAPSVGEGYSAVIGPLQHSFGSNKILVRDANDLVQGNPALSDLSPGSAFLDASGTAQLTVTLTHGGSSATTVALSYSNNKVSGPSSVTIPAGEASADITLSANGSAGDTTTITASYDGDSFSSTVTIYDDSSARSLVSLTPNPLSIETNRSADLTATLNLPARSGGQLLIITSTGDVSTPATVMIPAGSLSANIRVSAGNTGGAASVTAKLGTSSTRTANVNVSTGPPIPCLIISEYVEGSSYNKGIEIFNCGSTALQLSDFGVCQINNAETDCEGYQTMLPSHTLAPNEVFTICNSRGTLPMSCDLEEGSITRHNGDDRFLVFKDDNASGSFERGDDTVTDAFGETEWRPGTLLWENVTYRRCNFTPYFGQTLFEVSDYFSTHPIDDISDFGVAPEPGC